MPGFRGQTREVSECLTCFEALEVLGVGVETLAAQNVEASFAKMWKKQWLHIKLVVSRLSDLGVSRLCN